MKYLVFALLAIALLAFGCVQNPKGDENVQAVQNGDTVSVQYVGSFLDGNVFDQSSPGNDLNFTVGAHKVIAGFENAVLGMKEGETKTVTIPPAQAYGDQKESISIPLSQFKDANIVATVGMELNLENRIVGTVDSIDANNANVSYYSHPLGGKTLVFEITIKKIEKRK